MTEVLHLPELLLNIFYFVKRDSTTFTRCLSVNKTWREISVENAHQLLDQNIYVQCQGSIVKVGCADDKANSLEFRVPGYQAQLLAIAGAIEMVANKLSFRSRDIAERWFQTARRYIYAKPQNRPNPLTIVDWHGSERTASFAGGKLMAPVIRPKTGQLWFWVDDTHKNHTFDQAKEEILKAFKSTEPYVTVGASSLGLIGFDGRDRLWFKLGLSHTVHGLSESEYVTIESKTRAEAGLPKRKDGSKYKDYFHTGDINGMSDPICALDHENRFYISDSIGVHIIHPDARNHFDYHSTYKVNYEKNVFYEGKEVFYKLYKYVDVTGKLFVWSTSGCNGWSGTVGYWTYDGRQWKNVDLVRAAIYNIVVRVLEDRRQIWIFVARDIVIIEEPLSGDASPVLVPLEEVAGVGSAHVNRIIAQSADRHESILFTWHNAFLLNSKYKERKPQTLTGEALKLFQDRRIDNVYLGNNTILDDVLYFTDNKKIFAASLDGKTVTSFPCTETLPNPHILHVYMKPRKYGKPIPMIYLRGGNMTYLLDTSVKFVDYTGVPAVNFHLEVGGASSPSPAGHVYLFERGSKYYEWQATQLPQFAPAAFESVSSTNGTNVIYGNDGLMITYGDNLMFITQNDHYVNGEAEVLIDKHYDRLIKHLPFPPHRSFAETSKIVHDGLGNIWYTDSRNLSVRTPEGFIRLDTSTHRPTTNDRDRANIYAMAPLGNGSAVVLIEKYKALLLKINKQTQSLDIAEAPIGVHYNIRAAEWRDNVFYDKEGEVYVVSEEWNLSWEANGMHYKTYQLKSLNILTGKLLLIDRHNGKWFYQARINANIPSTLIYRPDPGTTEFKLEISLSTQVLGEDFTTDHSVWLRVDGGLTRVKFNGTALEVIEELKMVVQNSLRTVWNGRNVMWTSSYDSCTCLVLDEKRFI